MNRRHRIVLTTMEEDFKAIGLIPQLTESDDPSKSREIASPDPETMSGLDDSEGDKTAHSKSAKQPKPKMGPAKNDSSVMDPLEDGGSKGAVKGSKGTYHKVPGGKEASMQGEAKGYKASVQAKYTAAKKQPGPGKEGVKGGKMVSAPIAKGRKPVKQIAGMGKKVKSEGTLGKAANLLEEVNGILHGIQLSEETDHMLRGFRLVSENSALLADRLTELSDSYDVDGAIAALEEMSQDAAEVVTLIETELEDVGDDEDSSAIKHSGDAAGEACDEVEEDKDEPKSAKGHACKAGEENEFCSLEVGFHKQVEGTFQAMVGNLMNILEAYDATLDDIGGEYGEDDGDVGEDDTGEAWEGEGEFGETYETEGEHDDEDGGEGKGGEGEPEGDDGEPDGDEDGDEHGHEHHGGHDEPDGDEDGEGEQGDEGGEQDQEPKKPQGLADRLAALRGGMKPPFRG